MLNKFWKISLLLIPFLWLGCGIQQKTVQQTSKMENHQHSRSQIQSFSDRHYHAAMNYNSPEGVLKIEFLDQNEIPAKIIKAKRVKAVLKLPEGETQKFYLDNPEGFEHYYFSFTPSDPYFDHSKPTDTISIKKDGLKNLSAFKLRIWIPVGDNIYPLEYVYPERNDI